MKNSKNITYQTSGNSKIFVPKVMVFSGGEVNISLPTVEGNCEGVKAVCITAKITSSDSLIEVLLVTDALRTRHFLASISLHMPYAPYARQDRACNSGEALSAKIFSSIINAQSYEAVSIVDSHSDVMPALLDRCDNTHVSILIPYFLNTCEDTVLISPDAGSNKKVLEVSKALGGRTVIRADKVRDTKTGEISGTEVYADDFELVGKDCLIVDDICDGGRTFIELAKVLKAKGAATIELWVTHGIFSNGLQPLIDSGIDHIHTTDSFDQSPPHNNVTVHEVL